jgi:hypothetical protein
MDNLTLEQLLDHNILDTESAVNQILTILLADEGLFGFVAVILFIILYFIRRLALHKPREEEEEENLE